MILDRATLREVVDEARRAPSPHNIQPARWRLRGDAIELLEDPARRLFASDPSGRDHRLALGAAWEGTRLALGKRGFALADVVGAFVADDGVVVSGRVVEGGAADFICEHIGKRATWRGVFEPVDAESMATLVRRVGREGAVTTTERSIIEDAAAIIDDAAVEALLQPRFLEELNDWTRFSRQHPSYHRDGLNLETMNIGVTRGAILERLLKRPSFTALARIGAAGLVITEQAQTTSAAALVGVTAPRDEPDVVTGASLYRTWLLIAGVGLALCPMSVLTDTPALNARFTTALGIPADRVLVHLWRVGRPPHPLGLAPRLPVDELIVD